MELPGKSSPTKIEPAAIFFYFDFRRMGEGMQVSEEKENPKGTEGRLDTTRKRAGCTGWVRTRKARGDGESKSNGKQRNRKTTAGEFRPRLHLLDITEWVIKQLSRNSVDREEVGTRFLWPCSIGKLHVRRWAAIGIPAAIHFEEAAPHAGSITFLFPASNASNPQFRCTLGSFLNRGRRAADLTFPVFPVGGRP